MPVTIQISTMNIGKKNDVPIRAQVTLTDEELAVDRTLHEVVTIAYDTGGSIGAAVTIPVVVLTMAMQRIMAVKEQLDPKIFMPDSDLVGFKKGN